MKNNKKTLGIIGIGQFSEFFIPYLKPFFQDIYITSKTDKNAVAKKLSVKNSTLKEVCEQDIIMLSMPISQISQVLDSIKKNTHEDQIIIDICSVKIFPIKEMKKKLPKDVQILGTHPLFGPQSGKDGIKGLEIVLCPARIKDEDFKKIETVFKKMGLKITETTPQKHDEIMAYTQALTHFFSRAAAKTIPFEDFKFTTPSAKRLRNIINEVKDDSKELFMDMQTLNPYAEKTRKKFLTELNKINDELWKKK
ncbi:MAG: prephenate dehydrogenase [Candidatus Pacebacteria bacterium]|nr:prephenate dehydrogenase [Candidatus Paceibacterota bacterium]